MIRMPQRSVTRFFIPLIDVLTLLFCIYLLLPIVERRDDTTAPGDVRRNAIQESQRQRETQPLSAEERTELDRLRLRAKEKLKDRLAVRVLEIDPDTGLLSYYDPNRVEIRNEADARTLIERQKHESGLRDVYFLFLYPRRLTGYPEERQIKQYKRWFADVAHGFDNPGTGR